MDSCGESFFFYGLTDFILFLVLAWRYGFFLSEIFFVFFYPEYLALVPSATNPVQQLTFLLSISADGKESPLPFWGPSQSFGFSLLPSRVRRSARATICHPVSHSFSIRSPSTNICFSILTWICYFGIDPHSYDVLTVILWWLATVNSRMGNSSNFISIVSVGHHVTKVCVGGWIKDPSNKFWQIIKENESLTAVKKMNED